MTVYPDFSKLKTQEAWDSLVARESRNVAFYERMADAYGAAGDIVWQRVCAQQARDARDLLAELDFRYPYDRAGFDAAKQLGEIKGIRQFNDNSEAKKLRGIAVRTPANGSALQRNREESARRENKPGDSEKRDVERHHPKSGGGVPRGGVMFGMSEVSDVVAELLGALIPDLRIKVGDHSKQSIHQI